MKRDLQGIFLSMGLMGLGYVVLLIFLMLFTGVSIFKTVIIIAGLSIACVSYGLSSNVKKKIKHKLQIIFSTK